jgi:hypothetical protein
VRPLAGSVSASRTLPGEGLAVEPEVPESRLSRVSRFAATRYMYYNAAARLPTGRTAPTSSGSSLSSENSLKLWRVIQ